MFIYLFTVYMLLIIVKFYPTHFSDDSERFEDIRDELMLEQKNKKIKESFNKMAMEQRKVHLSMKQERHKSLIKEMDRLVNKISHMCDKTPDLKKSVETRYRAFGIFPFIFVASG